MMTQIMHKRIGAYGTKQVPREVTAKELAHHARITEMRRRHTRTTAYGATCMLEFSRYRRANMARILKDNREVAKALSPLPASQEAPNG